tara:strand:+ start:280 stop:465 length:186 start_codon:yes stop_codon:yes gene_type:complete
MSRLNIKTASLDELKNKCLELEGTTFGHNMIGIICNVVQERFPDEAEQFISIYGWPWSNGN